MDRRSFIERIAALIGIGRAASPAPTNGARQIELLRSSVVGFEYHVFKTVWPWLTVGTKLDLVREPDSAFGRRAVRVDWQGWRLGYIPADDTAAVNHLLHNGQHVVAEVIGLDASALPWDRIEFALYLNTGSPS